MKSSKQNNNDNSLTGGIDRALVKKEVTKGVLILLVVATFGNLFTFAINMGTFNEIRIEFYFEIVVIYLAVELIGCLSIRAYWTHFVASFQYTITLDSILINSGVFTKDAATVPFSRIQNITITQGIFDRKFKIYTVKLETAGSSGVSPQGGIIRPEGYIPGMRDPHAIQEQLKTQVARFSSIPGGLGDKIFASRDIAFDNFISYIISKMADGQGLQTRIAEFREQQGWSREQLADNVGASVEAIRFLEEGRYNPSLSLAFAIAKALGTRLEDLFTPGE